MPGLLDHPWLCLGFASLHLLVGQFGAALVYRLRFGGTPLILYRRGQRTAHQRTTQTLAVPTLLWATGLVLFAFSPGFRATWLGSPQIALSASWGWALGIGSLIGMSTAQFQMGAAFRVGQDESAAASQQLITEGLFRHSRNPVYVFSFFYLVGISSWAPCIAVMGACLCIGLLMHTLVLHEERHLRQRLGTAYRTYCRTVRRYL